MGDPAAKCSLHQTPEERQYYANKADWGNAKARLIGYQANGELEKAAAMLVLDPTLVQDRSHCLPPWGNVTPEGGGGGGGGGGGDEHQPS